MIAFSDYLRRLTKQDDDGKEMNSAAQCFKNIAENMDENTRKSPSSGGKQNLGQDNETKKLQ